MTPADRTAAIREPAAGGRRRPTALPRSLGSLAPLRARIKVPILFYDVTSLDLASGELRLIEVKGIGAATGTVLLTPNERRVAEDRRDCYWLYVVTNCSDTPRLEEPIRDPARLDWHEVTKVAHYYLSVDAMTKPMQVREDTPPYGRAP